MGRRPLDTDSLSGINTKHTRGLGEFSSGKNFFTRNGSLQTRSGYDEMTTAFTADVTMLFSAGMTGATLKLLAQEGIKLQCRTTTTWATLKSDLTAGKILKACRWLGKVILVNGPERLQYDIATGVLSTLVVEGVDAVPNLEHVITYKSRVFGWAPNYAGANYLKFCGYDINGSIDPTVWPPDFILDISGNSGSPILSVIPMSNHLLCLSVDDYWQVFGNTEDDYSIVYGGATNVYSQAVTALVGDIACWLGVQDGHRRVYAYSGSEPMVVSGAIEELIQDEIITNVQAFALNNQYWLVFKAATKSSIYVLDMAEEEWKWYHYETPIIITSAVLHGSYLGAKTLHVGTTTDKIYDFDGSVTDDGVAITTEFVIGPFQLQSREYKVRRLYINAEPVSAFDLSVYHTLDADAERGPKTIPFAADGTMVIESVSLGRAKGRACKIRITTTDKINELQKLTLVVSPRAVK